MKSKKLFLSLICFVFVFDVLAAVEALENDNAGGKKMPEIVRVSKIWDAAPHNAFTDLLRFRGRWFCTFREGEKHVYGDNGRIRVITSKNGRTWNSAVLLEEPGIDLRDPKLSVTPDGRLMLLAGGSVYEGSTLVTRQSRVSFSENGSDWTAWQPVLKPGDWLWRVTWFRGKAYGTAYNSSDKQWRLNLYSSDDGINYTLVSPLEVDGLPNEATLRFLPEGEMIAFVRREGGSKNAMIGHSKPPYTTWEWNEAGYRTGGPNFIVLGGNEMWASGRDYTVKSKMVLAEFGKNNYKPVLDFPSGGDNSYPGLYFFRNKLWVSYYSSHEGKTSIYLAIVRLPRNKRQ